ncbi:DUF1427 family protein [Phytobacter diazotrophicus]|uniref:DUF1427 family protein n=1 Tax=Phytobacter diazotrophicus TaxID=395631 RepID=UPI0014524669|nr:DUF1427 family protein [Phytobacter diazotrophicus]QJF16222.1 XapX domain-containing protein [Phytobacter diazotrophicus]
MSTALISLGAGVFIGLVYALLNVRSPAPPAVALVGLLGMLAGEQAVSALRSHYEPQAAISQPQAIVQTADRHPEAG